MESSSGAATRSRGSRAFFSNSRRAIVFATALVISGVTTAHAQSTNCATPQKAVESLLSPRFDLGSDVANSFCLEQGNRSAQELQELAKRAQRVLSALDSPIDVEAISDDPNYFDESGKHSATLHEDLPGVVLVREDDGTWRWSDGSLRLLAQRYQTAPGALDSIVKRLPPSFHGTLFGVRVWQYLALLLLVGVGVVIRKVIAFVVANRIKNVVDQLGQAWAARFVEVFASPGATLIMAGVLQVTYPELRLPLRAALVMSVAVRVLVVLSIVWAAYRFVDVIAARMARRAEETESKLDDQLVPLVRKALKVFVVVAGALFILQNLDVDVGSLLAGLGIGGIAFALAAKDTLANFFGSVMIFLDRPFQIGDWIRVGDVEGIVEEVGFRSTRVRTFYNSLVTVPNARFTETQIDNLGARQYRRCFVTLNLTYDTTAEQMQAFVEGVRAIIAANEFTRKDYYEVHMSAFGEHSLDVMVYFFFQVGTWSEELTQRHNVFLEILRLAQELGVAFAFPTRTLHLDQVAAPGEARHIQEAAPAARLAEVVRAFGPNGTRARPQGPRITDGYLAGTRAAGEDGSG